jgi:hypothetical protein
MRSYKIAAMVTHSGKHLETEVAAYGMRDAFHLFCAYLLTQNLCIDALCELDVSEVAE